MAYTTSDLDRIVQQLEASLSLGHAKVRFEGREIEYRSVKDIMQAIGYFRGLYSSVAGTTKIRNVFVVPNNQY